MKNARIQYYDIGLSDNGSDTKGAHTSDGQIKLKPIKVSVSNGDIKYSDYPVMAGHFLNDGLFSVEKAIDKHLNGELNCRIQLGLYPGEIGSYELILPNEKTKNFPGAIIMGLGRQGKLNMYLLTRSVEQAVAKYLSRYNHKSELLESVKPKDRGIGVASAAIGSGYGGLSIESSLRAILQGVQQANKKISKVYDDPKLISILEFTELYEEKAIDYVYTLENILDEMKDKAGFAFPEKKIQHRPGARKQLPFDDTSDWWTRIEILVHKNNLGIADGLKFVVSTDAARQEERVNPILFPTIKTMLEELSVKQKYSGELSRALFEMLIPIDFKDLLRKQNNLLLILQKETALYPWELLQDGNPDSRPMSVNSGMIRQLITSDFRLRIEPVVQKTALVVADPDFHNKAVQLPSAKAEGHLVAKLLAEKEYNVTTLVGANAGDILVKFNSGEYKIMHFSSHGVFNADPEQPTGILIGPDAYLTTSSFKQKSMVPELVFVNCCYLGTGDTNTEAITQHRYQLAANIGTQLIDIGVKAVLVAGWAIDDHAALEFAGNFYSHMFNGETFGMAVKLSRRIVYDDRENEDNTWGAFQCYGDPFYTIEDPTASKGKKRKNFVVEREAEIEIYNLMSRYQTGNYKSSEIEEELEKIIDRVADSKLESPVINEGIARMYYFLNKYPEAIQQYSRMLKENNAEFTLGALELFCNIRSQQYQKDWQEKKPDLEYVKLMQDVADDLERLMRFSETPARLLIAGNTFKRLALIQEGNSKLETYTKALNNYARAYENGTTGKQFNALVNWLLFGRVLDRKKATGVKTHPDLAKAKSLMEDEINLLKKESGTRSINSKTAEVLMMLICYFYGDPHVDIAKLSEAVKSIVSLPEQENELITEQYIFLNDLLNAMLAVKPADKKLTDWANGVAQLNFSESKMPA